MDDTLPLQVESNPRVPVEICEQVISAVYDDRYYLVTTALATLSSCALVCRVWRAPAQKVLFEYVMLRDKDAIHDFAELLDASPELGSYVHTLALRGYLHVPFSPAVLFPTILRGKLTSLQELHTFEYGEDEKIAQPLPDGVKELPTLPVHQYLPSLLTCISHIRVLRLYLVAFPSFGDLARILYELVNLQSLSCTLVSWAVLGQEPPFMAKYGSHNSQKKFLPHLRQLECINMDAHGIRRLLSALGPSLRRLYLDIRSINPEPSVVEEEEPINLQPFPRLHSLWFFLLPLPQPHDSMLASLRNTITSWASLNSDQRQLGDTATLRHRALYFHPCRNILTREDFGDILRVIGPVVEAALCREKLSASTPQAANDTRGKTADRESHDPCRANVVVQNLGDRLEWADWWRTRVAECFPTLAKWKRLEVEPCDNDDPTDKWEDPERIPDDAPQPTPTAPLPSMTAGGATSNAS